MDRKGAAYHVDMDSRKGSPQGSTRSRRESIRPGSASSSELSDTSSIGKTKSSAPKVVAVVIVSLIIVAGLVGVTIYLIDIEKEKQENNSQRTPSNAHQAPVSLCLERLFGVFVLIVFETELE